MKLTKLSSAVSVSLLAVALTACGGSNEANDPPVKVTTPEVNANTNTDAAKKAEEAKKAQEAAQKAQAAKVAALVAALKEAGLNDANATFVANSNPDLAIGSTDYNALLAAKLAEQKKVDESGNQGAAPTKTTSEVVVKSNPFIKGIDTSKNATVTANQYSRQPGSNFDRRANPSELGGLGEVGIDDPTVQNPYLSNYVLAVEAVNGKVVAIDSTGELVEAIEGNDKDHGQRVIDTASPYLKNGGAAYRVEHQDRGAIGFSYFKPKTNSDGYEDNAVNHSTNAVATDPTKSLTDKKLDKDGAARIVTIQELNHQNVLVNKDAADNALIAAVSKDATAAKATKSTKAKGDNLELAGALKSGLIVYTDKSVEVGNSDGAKLGYKVPTYGVEENIYNADGVALNAVDVGSKVAGAKATTGNNDNASTNLNFLAFERTQYSAPKTGELKTTLYQSKLVATDDNVAATSADIAGVQTGSNATENTGQTRHLANTVANSYETRVFGKNYNSYESGAKGKQVTPNTYTVEFNSKEQASKLKPAVLQYTQYGRLTNNIDVLADKDEKSKETIVYRQFQQHGADRSVDTYFYRGTHKTTLEQMEAVKAKGGVITYNGHALTYGIGPKVAATKVQLGLPTAYGLGTGEATIGNFVQAKYDIAKSRVDGSVYNLINSSVKPDSKLTDFVKQDLVTFGGDVYGNTVTGTATKLGLGEQGTFTGSFFGKEANELGGSISSIERSKGYTQPKWGAVFGATKGGSTVDNFNVIEQQNKTATP